MLAGQRVLFPLLLLLVVQACAEPEPESFSRGQAIPIATWTVKVNRVEVLAANALPAAAIQLFQSGEKLLAVHIRLEHEGLSEDIPPDFARLLRSVRLEDETGRRWGLRSVPLTDMHWRMLKAGSAYTLGNLESWTSELRTQQFLKSWVLPFFVSLESRGFRFYIKSYDHREGQPRLAVVDLGR
jgi:hypothetical protein